MDQIFCTLFDSNYIDKGLCLYDSMVKSIGQFRLYVFAFDQKSYDILKSEALENMTVVSLEEFETAELLKVKKERTRAEYCWTCSPWIIKHVLERYNEPVCTYIDADMKFFSSPQPVFDEMKKQGCSVAIVPHRFKSEKEERKAYEEVGIYCVEFNSFFNNEDGRKALDWWADRCLEWCFYAVPGTTEGYGDQKYLNKFPVLFEGVYICNHPGVGLAPWNVSMVSLSGMNNSVPLISDKRTGKTTELILYHYENVGFVTKHILNASSGMHDNRLRSVIYDDYIHDLIGKREMVEEKYGLRISRERRVVTRNPIMVIYQKYFLPIKKIKNFRDIHWVKET